MSCLISLIQLSTLPRVTMTFSKTVPLNILLYGLERITGTLTAVEYLLYLNSY